MDKEIMENILSQIKNSIQAIQRKQLISFGETYKNVCTLTFYKYDVEVYKMVREVITDHLIMKVRADVLTSTRKYFLQILSQAWNDHKMSMECIANILKYMDRLYAQQNNLAGQINTYDFGLVIFRDQIFLYGCIHDQFRENVLDMIMRKHKGEAVDRLTIKNICQMLQELDNGSKCIYEEDFEKPVLKHLSDLYRMESQQFLEENDASAYINKAEQRINDETESAKDYLDESTRDQIYKMVINEFIHNHMKAIIEMENSVIHMLKNQKTEELACMYKLFRRIPDGLKTMFECISAYFREQGKALVTEKKKKALVKNLLDLKNRFHHLLLHSFDEDKYFKQMITSDFEYILYLNPRLPECLSHFIDDKLKKRRPEEEIKLVLDDTVVLISYLKEKNVFEQYYEQHLAKRFLLSDGISMDFEKHIVSELKAKSGCQFASKLEGLFKDISLSDTMKEEFEIFALQSGIDLHNVDLNVRVLKTEFWPLQGATSKCNIPVIPRNVFTAFTRLYLTKHSGRLLTLQPQLGSVDLKAVFFGLAKVEPDSKHRKRVVSTFSKRFYSPRKYIIQVSTYQMCVLMLFNTKDRFTYQEISSKTHIPQKDLICALQSLVMGKIDERILLKMPNTKVIEPSHQFTVNDSFCLPLHTKKILKLCV